MDAIKEFLNPERMDTVIVLIMNVVIAVVILIIGFWIAKKVKNMIIKIGAKSPKFDAFCCGMHATAVRSLDPLYPRICFCMTHSPPSDRRPPDCLDGFLLRTVAPSPPLLPH